MPVSGSIVEWRRAERDEGKGGGAFEEANERDIDGRAEEDGMVIQLHKRLNNEHVIWEGITYSVL